MRTRCLGRLVSTDEAYAPRCFAQPNAACRSLTTLRVHLAKGAPDDRLGTASRRRLPQEARRRARAAVDRARITLLRRCPGSVDGHTVRHAAAPLRRQPLAARLGWLRRHAR